MAGTPLHPEVERLIGALMNTHGATVVEALPLLNRCSLIIKGLEAEVERLERTEWNDAIDEAVEMCAFVEADERGATDGKDGDYIEGWEAACERCAEYIADLKLKPMDKESQP